VVTYDGSFGTTEDLHSDVIENEQEKILLKYLKQFPKDFRRIILLKYRGFSDEEIMVKTKVSQAKIRGKFNHFKRKFREDIIEKRRCIS
jgi:DNA-directed RNA polymerase specialized sigma24 family protein